MKLIWTDTAVKDLVNIKNYIANDSEVYSLNFVQEIFNTIEKLYDFPAIGRKVPEANNDNIRELIYLNYRIIYKKKQNSVIILSIIHGARSLNNMETKPWNKD